MIEIDSVGDTVFCLQLCVCHVTCSCVVLCCCIKLCIIFL